MRYSLLALAAAAALSACLAGCGGADCATTLTCEAPASGGGGHAGTGGAGGVSSNQGGGGDDKPNGIGCGTGDECVSGLCVDSVCCESECAASCEACDVSGHEGACTPHEPATDPEGECAPGLCSGFGACATGEEVWTIRIGGDIDSIDMAVDSTGAVVVAAVNCCGSLEVDGESLTGATGNQDIYLVKLNPDGSTAWYRAYHESVTEYIGHVSVAVDASDNIVLAGYSDDATTFGGPTTLDNSIYVARLSPGGAEQGTSSFAASGGLIGGGAFVQDLVLDATGNVYVVGRLDGSLTICGDTMSAPSGEDDLYAFKLNAAGSCQWAFHWPTSGNFRAAATDGEGLYVTGGFRESLDFGNTLLTTTPGDLDIFLARLDAGSGAEAWSKQFGDAAGQTGRALALHVSGDVLFAGDASGAVDFGGAPLPGAADEDLVLARFSNGGAHRSSSRHGDGTVQRAGAVAGGPNGEIYLAGENSGTIEFDGVTLTAASLVPYAAALSEGGPGLWAHETGDFTGGFTGAEVIAVDKDGNVITLAGINDQVFVTKRAP